MNRYSTLHFFDKAGREIPTAWVDDNGLYHATVYMSEVSTNLFETETIYVVQEGYTGTEVDYFSPFVAADSAIEASFLDGSVFSLFSVSAMTAADPEIRLETSIRRQHTFPQTAVLGKHVRIGDDDIEDGAFQDGVPVVNPTQLKREAFRFDICLHSTQSGTFEDRLVLRDLNLNREVIIEIYVYGEVIGEDERLRAKLADFGEFLMKQDESLFRTSDIKEDLVDAVLLNTKRKEFLLEMHNIKPYLSSYRGILNVLQLFDYPDLTLKEYWLNKTTGKLVPETVRLDETQENNTNLNVDTNLRKTTLFGLYYPMNRVVKDKWDTNGNPLTEETFLFSHEEALLKLFGLRRWIEHRDIGGWSTILDVIGEKTFFNLYRIVFFDDRWTVITSSPPDRELRFTINGQENDAVKDERYLSSIVVFLEDSELHYDDLKTFDEDMGRTPMAFLTCQNAMQHRTFNDVDVSYNAITYPTFPIRLTYANISWYEYYGIEFVIRGRQTGTTRSIFKHVLLDDYSIFDAPYEIALPRADIYDIMMKLYMYNRQSSITKNGIVRVEARHPQVLMFTQTSDITTERMTFMDFYRYPISQLNLPYCWISTSTYVNINHERMLPADSGKLQSRYFDRIVDSNVGYTINDDDLLTFRNIDEKLDGLLIGDVPNTYHEMDNTSFTASQYGTYRVSTEQIRVRPMSSVFFSVYRFFDNYISRISEAMVGQHTAQWTLTDAYGRVVRERQQSLYFHHLFFYKGCYDITLEVEDIHGNKSTLHRKNAVVIY